jgi:hypothetical protein
LSGRRNNVKVDYWTPENTGAKYPAPNSLRSGDNPAYGSTLGYFDASYMKIRNITLGYNFESNDWLKRAGISKLRFYFSVQNPFVMFSPYHKESGLDPEPNAPADNRPGFRQTATGFGGVGDNKNLDRILLVGTNSPVTRNYLFGINLTF